MKSLIQIIYGRYRSFFLFFSTVNVHESFPIKENIFYFTYFRLKVFTYLRTFWRATQNLLILALSSLYSKQTFKVHFGS